MRDWRDDLATAVWRNTYDVELNERVLGAADPRALVLELWRSTVRYSYMGEAHRIGSWAECKQRGGACADAAAFVVAAACIMGQGKSATVCCEAWGSREDYAHARAVWLGRVLDPTVEHSVAVIGGCHRLASGEELRLRGAALAGRRLDERAQRRVGRAR